MVGHLLLRGMVVGLVAGLLAFGFAKIFGEPQIDYAIGFEEHSHSPHSHRHGGEAAPEPEPVSRATQAGLGLFTALVIYGAALGGLFSLAFAFANGRTGAIHPRILAGLLAVVGFVALVLVPQLKYPANPPAIGSAETIVWRTQLFLLMLLASSIGAALAVWIARQVVVSYGIFDASIAAVLGFLLVVTIAGWVLPAVDEVPATFSASVLWRFRLASLGIHAVLWGVLGLLFGLCAEQSSRRRFRLIKPI